MNEICIKCNTTLICYNSNTDIAYYFALLVVTIITTLLNIILDRQWKFTTRNKDKTCLKLSIIYILIILFVVFVIGFILRKLFFLLLENEQ